MFSIVRKIGSSFVGQRHIFHNLLGLLLMGVMKVAVFMVRAAQRVTAAVVFCFVAFPRLSINGGVCNRG